MLVTRLAAWGAALYVQWHFMCICVRGTGDSMFMPLLATAGSLEAAPGGSRHAGLSVGY